METNTPIHTDPPTSPADPPSFPTPPPTRPGTPPLITRLLARTLHHLFTTGIRPHPLDPSSCPAPPPPPPSALLTHTLQSAAVALDAALAAHLPHTYASLPPAARAAARLRFAARLAASAVALPPPLPPSSSSPLLLLDTAACRDEAFDRASATQEPAADAAAYVRALEVAGVARGRGEALFLAGVVWPRLGREVVARLVERVGGRERAWGGGGWVMVEVPEACLICLEEFGGEGDEDEEPVRLACGHVLGERCVRRWLRERNTCVVCRGLVYRYVPRLGEEEGMDLAGPDGRRVFSGREGEEGGAV